MRMEKWQGGKGGPSRGPASRGAGVGKMEDSIIGEGYEQRWLPARQEGTEMRGSLKTGGSGGRVATQKE